MLGLPMTAKTVGAVIVDTSEFALKAILTAKVSDPFTLQLGATYNSGPSFYSNGADWSVGASGKFQVNEKLALTAGAQYFGGDYTSGGGEWAAGIVANYTVVPQFSVELAVNYNLTTTLASFTAIRSTATSASSANSNLT